MRDETEELQRPKQRARLALTSARSTWLSASLPIVSSPTALSFWALTPARARRRKGALGSLLFLAQHRKAAAPCLTICRQPTTQALTLPDPSYEPFLLALHWWKAYQTDSEMKARFGQRAIRRSWYYTKKIRALKDPQIRWVLVDANAGPRGTGVQLENGWKAVATPFYHAYHRNLHENFHHRIKSFEALNTPFRHGVVKHKVVFEAVCVVMQYDMENGRPLSLFE